MLLRARGGYGSFWTIRTWFCLWFCGSSPLLSRHDLHYFLKGGHGSGAASVSETGRDMRAGDGVRALVRPGTDSRPSRPCPSIGAGRMRAVFCLAGVAVLEWSVEGDRAVEFRLMMSC